MNEQFEPIVQLCPFLTLMNQLCNSTQDYAISKVQGSQLLLFGHVSSMDAEQGEKTFQKIFGMSGSQISIYLALAGEYCSIICRANLMQR